MGNREKKRDGKWGERIKRVAKESLLNPSVAPDQPPHLPKK